MEQREKKPEKYQVIKLPHDPFRVAGERLIQAPEVRETPTRYCLWRLQEQDGDEGSGILGLFGPPGTGKSCTARFIADAAMRRLGGRGNALIVHTPALFSEELGRSAKLVADLFAAIEFSAAHDHETFCIWDDAEGIFVSREQVIAAKDPTDLLKVTATLNEGFDRLRDVKHVMHIATANFTTGVIDPAIVDRIDYVIPFALPTLQERVEIIRRRVNGLVGELVLAQLAEATEGWSGRRLSKLVMQAYLASSVRTRKELTVEDFLRAVGITPSTGDVVTNGNGAHPLEAETESLMAEEMTGQPVAGTAAAQQRKEDDLWQSPSHNGSRQEPSPPMTKSRLLVRLFELWEGCLALPRPPFSA
jgi:SpoVK/Ycf46/Vps4 family AAA+-type ATPase